MDQRQPLERYADIEDLFGDELATPETLPYFLDWLLDNVELVEISTYNEEDGYAIFETMNDRGLSLTPAEMLKEYLLSKLDTEATRADEDKLWRRKIDALKEWGEEEDANFLKAWLRGQYATTIREHRGGASNQDFERIGTEFHKWVLDNGAQQLGLRTSTEFARFIDTQFAGYIDIFIFRRVINAKSLASSSIQDTLFNVILDIRRKSVPELVEVLKAEVARLDKDLPLDGILTFRLNQQNKKRVRGLLARLTAHLEQQAGRTTSFSNYIDRAGRLVRHRAHLARQARAPPRRV